MTSFIGPEEFLSRSKNETILGYARSIFPTPAPAVDRLFVANLDRKADVASLIGAMLLRGVSILFEDNTLTPNYARTIRLVGTKPALLAALVEMTNHYKPVSVHLREQPDGMGTVLDLWWD